MRRGRIAAACALSMAVFLPALALASSSAGFAAQSLFLSRSSITEGESVTAYTNVVNNSNALFAGTVHFSASGTELGSQNVTLPAGIANVMSLSWQPTPGIYTVEATLEDSNGHTLAQASAKLSVASKIAPPTATSTPTTTIESSTSLVQDIAHVSQPAASTTAPAFAAVDHLRQAAVNVLDGQIHTAQQNIPGHSATVASSSAPAHQGAVGTIFAFFWTLYFYALTILRAIAARLVYFYPVVALLFIYILYKIYRRISPRHRYRY